MTKKVVLIVAQPSLPKNRKVIFLHIRTRPVQSKKKQKTNKQNHLSSKSTLFFQPIFGLHCQQISLAINCPQIPNVQVEIVSFTLYTYIIDPSANVQQYTLALLLFCREHSNRVESFNVCVSTQIEWIISYIEYLPKKY